MPRVCEFTGRKTTVGHMYTRRGKAKYLGGVGTTVTGKTKRKFKANVHTLTVVVGKSVKRMKVSTKAMRMGLVIKPPQRRFVYKSPKAQEAATASAGNATAAPESGTSQA
jgi:large subunit ribosomal protein L28